MKDNMAYEDALEVLEAEATARSDRRQSKKQTMPIDGRGVFCLRDLANKLLNPS